MARTRTLTTITDAAAEVGLPRSTFKRRLAEMGIEPAARVPHSPRGKGFTPAQMRAIRKAFGVASPV